MLSNWPLKKSACIKHGSFWISVFYYMDIFDVIYTQIFKSSLLKHGDWKIWTVLPYKTSVFQYTDIFESSCILKHRDSKFLCFIHGDFCISVYGNMEIGKYEQFCLTKPLCFNTKRFLNLCELKYGDSKISMFRKFCL